MTESPPPSETAPEAGAASTASSVDVDNAVTADETPAPATPGGNAEKSTEQAAVQGEPVLAPQVSVDGMAKQAPWDDLEESLGRWKQGHLVRGIPLTWIAPTDTDPMTALGHEQGVEAPQWPDGSFDAIICSQTCDIGGTPPGTWHPFVTVAPLVHQSALGSNSRRSDASGGRLDYLVATLPANEELHEGALAAYADGVAKRAEKDAETSPQGSKDTAGVTSAAAAAVAGLPSVRDVPHGHRWYADLRLQVPISKALLLDRDPIDGFVTEEESLEFGEVLAQKFRRPALHVGLSEHLPAKLEEFVRGVGHTKQCMAQVEQVRLHILEGNRLNPTRGQLLVITTSVPLDAAAVEQWEAFNDKAAQVFNANDITYAPIVHYVATTMPAVLYRETVPVRCRLLGHTRFP